MAAAVRVGAEAESFAGGRHGALVLHGFTGSPYSMRGIARALAGVGFTVELPLLPGHGTAVEGLVPSRFADWLVAAEKSYVDLASRVDDVIVVGLSMGGTLAASLAAAHPEIAGAAFVNPFIAGLDDDSVGFLRAVADSGQALLPGLGASIADPDATELAYDETPVRALLSLVEAAAELQGRLDAIACPVLIVTSVNDPVVPPVSSDVLAGTVTGPVERVFVERSLHVATVDYDKDDIERRIVAFALGATN
jgi:carboxylesterase